MTDENYWPPNSPLPAYEYPSELLEFLKVDLRIVLEDISEILESAKIAYLTKQQRSGATAKQLSSETISKYADIKENAKQLFVSLKALEVSERESIERDFDAYISQVEMALWEELAPADDGENGEPERPELDYIYTHFKRRSVFDVLEFFESLSAPPKIKNKYEEFIHEFCSQVVHHAHFPMDKDGSLCFRKLAFCNKDEKEKLFDKPLLRKVAATFIAFEINKNRDSYSHVFDYIQKESKPPFNDIFDNACAAVIESYRYHNSCKSADTLGDLF